jgi:hypothetical protein
VYSNPCDCSRCYIGETSRPLEVSIKEHKYNLTQIFLEKSKLAQHAYEEGHRICWKGAKVLQIESNTTYRKYKEAAHMSLLDHPISQPNLDISPIWIPRDHSRGEETTAPPLLVLVKISSSMLASQGVLLHSHEVFNRVFCFSCVITIRSLLFFSIDGVDFIIQ